MIRHIFMCTIKDGVSDELVEKKMAEMRAMKDGVPEIEADHGSKESWLGRPGQCSHDAC